MSLRSTPAGSFIHDLTPVEIMVQRYGAQSGSNISKDARSAVFVGATQPLLEAKALLEWLLVHLGDADKPKIVDQCQARTFPPLQLQAIQIDG